jgi:carbon-monoxide dehydrogenase medium subunit
VKAPAFDYVRPTSLNDALALLAQFPEGKLIAGGQSLLASLNLRLSQPSHLIDIGRLPELRGVVVQTDRLRIGALTRHVELMHAPEIAAHAPLLAQAINHVAHAAIRSRGTIGGSLANADPAAELPACVLALDARIEAVSVRGKRLIKSSDFFTGLFETALAPDEILTAIEVDLPKAEAVHGFSELARRSGDYAIVGLAAQGVLRQGGFAELRLGYFSVGSRATLALGAAAVIVKGGSIDQAAEALATDLDPHDDLQASGSTRLHLARVLLKRVVASMSPSLGIAA